MLMLAGGWLAVLLRFAYFGSSTASQLNWLPEHYVMNL
jgi:hypothetical protein